MRRRSVFGWLIATAMITLGCSLLPASAQPSVALAEAQRIATVFQNATADGNANAIALLYDTGARLFAPNGAVVSGRDAIREVYAANHRAGKNTLAFEQVQVDGDAENAVLVWVWTLSIEPRTSPPITTRGRSMLYIKRTDEGWRIFLDMLQGMPNE